MEAMTLWNDFRRADDVDVRDRILARHLPLVHHVARRVHRSVAPDAEFDDLVSAGTMGLISAVESFDPGRGHAFSTYAAPRIHGAILDELRRWDHAPRSIRRKQRDLSRAENALARDLGRAPTEPELADRLGIPLESVWSWKAAAEDVVQISLDQRRGTDDTEGSTPADVIPGVTAADLENDLTQKEELALLIAEIGNLKEQERVVLSLYFFKELKLHEIAQVLGLTESRISQIRTKALNTLRARLAHLRETV